ncbi:hypothetical protein [Symbiopectobacterium purcellii]
MSLSYTFEPTLIGKNEKQLNGFDAPFPLETQQSDPLARVG